MCIRDSWQGDQAAGHDHGDWRFEVARFYSDAAQNIAQCHNSERNVAGLVDHDNRVGAGRIQFSQCFANAC